MDGTGIKISLNLAEDAADALAVMVKRICWTDIKALSADNQEATAMLDGLLTLRKTLAATGFEPR